MAELLKLKEQEIPDAMDQLRDSQVNLKKVADYCEANYMQASSEERKKALDETRKYTTQALASVAYQINTLATSFLSLLDLQANQLADIESNINHLSQTVAIHKEKVARREIGVLTTNKSFYRPVGVRPPGIVFPEQEKPIKYNRKTLDFTLLDSVGHGGCKTSQSSARPNLHRPISVSSESSSAGHEIKFSNGPSFAGTLTKNPLQSRPHNVGTPHSARSHAPPPVAPPTVPSHYMSSQQLMQAQQSNSPVSVANSLYGSPAQIPPPPPLSVAPQGLENPYTGSMVVPPSPMSPPLPPMPAPDFVVNEDIPLPPPLDSPSDLPSGDFPLPDYLALNDENASFYEPQLPPHLPGMHEDPAWAPAQYIEKVVAIYDYEPQNEDELCFKENSIIYVVNKNEDGWWEGIMESDGNPIHGLFPENYVESLL